MVFQLVNDQEETILEHSLPTPDLGDVERVGLSIACIKASAVDGLSDETAMQHLPRKAVACSLAVFDVIAVTVFPSVCRRNTLASTLNSGSRVGILIVLHLVLNSCISGHRTPHSTRCRLPLFLSIADRHSCL